MSLKWDGLFRCEIHPAGTHPTIEEAEACIQEWFEPTQLPLPLEAGPSPRLPAPNKASSSGPWGVQR